MSNNTIIDLFREAAKHNDHLSFIELAGELKTKMHACIEDNDLIGLESYRSTLMHALKNVASLYHDHDLWGVQNEPFIMAIAHLLPFNSKAAFRHLGVYPLLDDYLLKHKIDPKSLDIVSEDYKTLLTNCLLRCHYEVFEQSVVGLFKQVVGLEPTNAIYRRVVYEVLTFLGAYPDVGEFSEESRSYLEQVASKVVLRSSMVYFSNMSGLQHAGLRKTLMARIETTIDSMHGVDFHTKDEQQLRSLYAFIRPELNTTTFTKVAKAMLNSTGALGRQMLAVEIFHSNQYSVQEFTSGYLKGIKKPENLYLLIEQYLADHPVPSGLARHRVLHVLNAAIENDISNNRSFTPERFEQSHRIPKSFYSETDWGMVNQLEGDLGL